jgi:hypothetical protein
VFGAAAVLHVRHTAAQRLHKIDDTPRHGKARLGSGSGAGRLGFEMREQRLLVAIMECAGVKAGDFAIEDAFRQAHHVRCKHEFRQLVKALVGVPDLVGIPQGRGEQPLPIRLKRDHPLALGENQPAQCRHASIAHDLPDYGKGFLAERLVRHHIIWRVQESLVDLCAGDKAVDLDDMVAFNFDRFQLRILDQEVLSLGDLVAAAFVLRGDRLAGFLVDQLLAQAIAGGLVDLAERDPLGRRRSGLIMPGV